MTAPNTENIEARLCDYIEGDLDEAGRIEIERHLQAHPHHRKLIAELAQTRDMLKGLPRASAPPEILEAVESHMERNQLLGSNPSESLAALSRRSFFPRFLAAAAMVMLTAGLGAVVFLVIKTKPPHFVEAPSQTFAQATSNPADRDKATAGDLAGDALDDTEATKDHKGPAGSIAAANAATEPDGEGGGALAMAPAMAPRMAMAPAMSQRAGVAAGGDLAHGISEDAANGTARSHAAQQAAGQFDSAGKPESAQSAAACVLVITSADPAATGGRIVQSLLENNIPFSATASPTLADALEQQKALKLAAPAPTTESIAAPADILHQTIAAPTTQAMGLAAATPSASIHSQYTAAALKPSQISSLLASLIANKQSDQLLVYNAPPQVQSSLASADGLFAPPTADAGVANAPAADAKEAVMPTPDAEASAVLPAAAASAMESTNKNAAPSTAPISLAAPGAVPSSATTAPSGVAGATPNVASAVAAAPIQPGDALNINLADVQSLNGASPVVEMTVANDGTISLPQIGAVQAAGKTPTQLSDAISAAYLSRDPNHPGDVIVTLEQSATASNDQAANTASAVPQNNAMQNNAMQNNAMQNGDGQNVPEQSAGAQGAATAPSAIPSTLPFSPTDLSLANSPSTQPAGQSSDAPRDLVIVVEQASASPTTAP